MKGKWRSLFKFQLLKTLEFTSPRIWHIVKLCDIELSPLAPLPVGALRERWERGSEYTLKANGDHLLIPHYIENPNISLILWNSTQLPSPPGVVLWGRGSYPPPLGVGGSEGTLKANGDHYCKPKNWNIIWYFLK